MVVMFSGSVIELRDVQPSNTFHGRADKLSHPVPVTSVRLVLSLKNKEGEHEAFQTTCSTS